MVASVSLYPTEIYEGSRRQSSERLRWSSSVSSAVEWREMARRVGDERGAAGVVRGTEERGEWATWTGWCPRKPVEG
jgi:hypothetical protein